MSSPYQRIGVAGTGTIASGLAACASMAGEVVILGRSGPSVEKGLARAQKACGQVEGADDGRISTTTEMADLEGCDVVVEAIVEDLDSKVDLHSRLAEALPGADLATTTSTLPIGEMGSRAGAPERLYALHVFNPVPRMELIELCFPEGVADEVRDRGRAFCEAIGKTGVEVPDTAGFVVNRLLFPFLFDAVRFMEESGLSAADVDRCMTLGAGHPMGPTRLLDFVGLDVSEAIGEELYRESGNEAHRAPESLKRLAAEGHLGRKAGRGFNDWSKK